MIDINEPVEQGHDLVVAENGEHFEQRLVGSDEFEKMYNDEDIAFPPRRNFVNGPMPAAPDINNPAHGNLHGIGFEVPEEKIEVTVPEKRTRRSKR